MFLPRVLRFWVGIFYLQALFTLHSFPAIWHNLLLSRFHWKPAATFLKVAGLHIDPRNINPAHLLVWFTVIHNLLYISALYLCIFHIYCKSFTYGENFDKISSHTIQQPWKYKAAAKLVSNQITSISLNCSLKKCISRLQLTEDWVWKIKII